MYATIVTKCVDWIPHGLLYGGMQQSIRNRADG